MACWERVCGAKLGSPSQSLFSVSEHLLDCGFPLREGVYTEQTHICIGATWILFPKQIWLLAHVALRIQTQENMARKSWKMFCDIDTQEDGFKMRTIVLERARI